MGGGVLRPPEFFTYTRLLEGYIKAGWRWPNRRQALVARVAMQLEPDGRVLNIELVSPSGNSEFDESVLRAVRKSSPVPPAPSSVYGKYFRNVTITFDPRE